MSVDLLVLEARLRRLEDIEAIRTLRYWYAHHSNVVASQGGDADRFAKLFTEDGEWKIGFGAFKGRDAISTGLRGAIKDWVSVMHFMLNPLISVEGDRATGIWSGLFPFVAPRDPRPTWGSIIYHDDYVRTGEGWKFQKVEITKVFQPAEHREAYGGISP